MGGRDKREKIKAVIGELSTDPFVRREPIDLGEKHSHPGKNIDHLPSSMKKMKFT